MPIKHTREILTPGSRLYKEMESHLGVRPIRSDIDLAKLVDSRLSTDALTALTRHGLSEQEIYRLIIPRRTLSHRRRKHQRLSQEESDRAVRVARAAALTEQVFGNSQKSLAWLRKPKRRFEGRPPLELLATEAGARLVEEMLYQIDDGMAA